MWKNSSQAHPQVKKLLNYRFLSAVWQSYLIEFQLLCLYLVYLWFDIDRPWQSICLIIDGTILSYNTWSQAQLLMPFVAAYGLLMRRMQQYVPQCLSSWPQRLQEELQHGLCLLCLIIGWSYCSSWLYLRYIDILNLNRGVELNKHYIMLNCIFCGVYYCCNELRQLGCEKWPWQEQTTEQPAIYLLRSSYLRFGLRESYVPTVLHVILNWSEMRGGYLVDLQLLWHAWCLAALLLAQLHASKEIYNTIMQQSLPLVLHKTRDSEDSNKLEHIKLSVFLAITETSLPGFQLQAARDFYYLLEDNRQFTELFQLQGNVVRETKNWYSVRDLLLAQFEQFMRTLQEHLNIINVANVLLDRPNFAGMRPLMLPAAAAPTNYWSRRSGDKQFNCIPTRPVGLLSSKQLAQLLAALHSKLSCWYSSQLKNFSLMISEPKTTTYELCSESTVYWLIKALNQICKRSLTEDKFGSFCDDLERILKTLLAMEELLNQLQKLLNKNKQIPCRMLTPTLEITRHSISMAVRTFQANLDYLIEDEQLLEKLKLYL